MYPAARFWDPGCRHRQLPTNLPCPFLFRVFCGKGWETAPLSTDRINRPALALASRCRRAPSFSASFAGKGEKLRHCLRAESIGRRSPSLLATQASRCTAKIGHDFSRTASAAKSSWALALTAAMGEQVSFRNARSVRAQLQSRRKGLASQLQERKCQGTTSVVPQAQQNRCGP